MKAPAFWALPSSGYRAALLTPLSWIWRGLGALRRWRTETYRPSIPVICVGNVVLGGAGKTPVAMDIAQRLIEAGHRPHFLSRGYGGTEQGPLQVDLDAHDHRQVGDEPLLLARIAPTWIARDRVAGAKAAEQAGATHIVMDDGYQNTALDKTVSILVVDSEYGFGNGKVCPAGPLREPPKDAISRADALILLGQARQRPKFDRESGIIPFSAEFTAELPEGFQPRDPVIAFAGIGRPEKFFATARSLELVLAGTQAFPDHHPFTENDMDSLRKMAQLRNARLLTTEKDAVRIPAAMRDDVTTLPVRLNWGASGDPSTVVLEKCGHVG